MDKSRIYYADFLRAFLMILGIFYHTASIYGSSRWYVSSGHHNFLIHSFAEVSHLFRMPAFFILAGFFAMLMLERRSRLHYIRVRFRKLAIPMLVCGFTINFIMNIYATNRSVPSDIFEYVWGGYWLGHLWFLGSLLVYSSLLAVFASPIVKATKTVKNPFILVSIIFSSCAYILYLSGVPSDLHAVRWFFVSVGVTIQYAPFFILGCLIFKNNKIECFFISFKNNFIALFLFSVFYFLFRSTWVEDNLFLWTAIKYICFYSVSGLVFAIFKYIFDYPSFLSRDLSEASYTMYLLHQPFLVYAYHLVPSSWGPISSFLILSISTCLLTYFAHAFVVCRLPFISFAFNGVWGVKKNPEPSS